jgi:hypothetical protein
MTLCISWSLQEYAGFMCLADILFMARCTLSSAAFQNFHSIDGWGFTHPAKLTWNILELRVTVSTVYPSATLLTICDISWSSSVLHTCSYSELHVLLYNQFIHFQFKTSSPDIMQCFISLKVEATLLEILLVETFTGTLGSRVSFVRGVIWLRDSWSGARNRPV